MSTPTLIERARDEIETNGPRFPLLHGMADFVLAFAKALPGLYREHGIVLDEWAPGRFRMSWCPVRVGVAETCTCGADEHNARLDALADKLGIPAEQRHAP